LFVNDDGEFKFTKTIAGTILLWTNGQRLRLSALVGGAPSLEIDATTGKVIVTNETASTPVKLDANKGITSGAFGTSAGEFCEGNDARILAASRIICSQNTDTSHTGSTSQTIISNIPIPANSMGANDFGTVEAMFYKTGTAGTATWTVYIGPNSNSLAGASVLFNSVNTATQLHSSGIRTIANKGAQNINYAYQQAGGTETPWLNLNTARAAINQDFANELYLIVAVALSNAADRGGVDWIYFEKR